LSRVNTNNATIVVAEEAENGDSGTSAASSCDGEDLASRMATPRASEQVPPVRGQGRARDRLGRWLPGTSGNPHGRPRRKVTDSVLDAFRRDFMGRRYWELRLYDLRENIELGEIVLDYPPNPTPDDTALRWACKKYRLTLTQGRRILEGASARELNRATEDEKAAPSPGTRREWEEFGLELTEAEARRLLAWQK